MYVIQIYEILKKNYTECKIFSVWQSLGTARGEMNRWSTEGFFFGGAEDWI
jgi:hypothetical protein